jgi:hypothetical protein
VVSGHTRVFRHGSILSDRQTLRSDDIWERVRRKVMEAHWLARACQRHQRVTSQEDGFTVFVWHRSLFTLAGCRLPYCADYPKKPKSHVMLYIMIDNPDDRTALSIETICHTRVASDRPLRKRCKKQPRRPSTIYLHQVVAGAPLQSGVGPRSRPLKYPVP